MEVPVTQRAWVICLLCFFCFPVGFVLFLSNPRVHIHLRIILVGLSLGWVLYFLPQAPHSYVSAHPTATALVVLPVLIVTINLIGALRLPGRIRKMIEKNPDVRVEDVAGKFNISFAEASSAMASVQSKQLGLPEADLRASYVAQAPVVEPVTSPIHDFVREQFAKNRELAYAEIKVAARYLADEWVVDTQSPAPYRVFEKAISDVKSERVDSGLR